MITQLVASVAECLLEPFVQDKYLGTLHRNDSYFCTAQTQRVPQGVLCCTPQPSDQIRLLLSTPGQGEREVKFHDESLASTLKNEKKVVYLAHGWLEKISDSPWVNSTR